MGASVTPRWLLAVRVFSLLSALTMCPFVLAAFLGIFPAGLVLVVGFGMVVYSHQRRLYTPNLRKGLAQAVAEGVATLGILLSALLMWTHQPTGWDGMATGLAGFALAPVLLLVSTIMALRRTAPEPGGKLYIGAAVGHAFLYAVAPWIGMSLAIFPMLRSRIAVNQAAAVASLRAINTAMATYQSNYHHGYAPSLKVLGPLSPGATGGQKSSAAPSCQAADLIDNVLAAGRKMGYLFEITPGAPAENPVPGCRLGVATYAVTARPESPGQGIMKFYSDQTGVIRSTGEDRPATAHDPPLGD